jgi:hypothetical protein
MHESGVRGVRFNFVRRLVDFTPKDVLLEIATRIAPLGWHVVVYFEAADLPELWDFFTALPTTVVVDHMGRPDVRQPVDGPEFERFVRLLREHQNIWSKVSCPERLSVSGPPALDGERAPYRDVVPFARRIVETFPDRVLWGTDWPHPNLKDHMPDDGLLVDFIPHIARPPSCSASCWSTTRCACIGRRNADAAGQTVPGRARDHHLRRRAVAQRLLAQPVLRLADEGREPRALQGRRACLPRRVADERGAEAGGAGARPEPVHRAGRQHLLPGARSAPPTARASSRWPAA